MQITFCTYFKKITRFIYTSETYDDFTAFCVKNGKFRYSIGGGEKRIISGGEVVVCPPRQPFWREIIEDTELCMIKFKADDFKCVKDAVKISGAMRFDDDMDKLEKCLFIYDMDNYPIFTHYCMDIIYLIEESGKKTGEGEMQEVKRKIGKSYNGQISLTELSKDTGYTVPHLINKFKDTYGVTPKAYLSKIRLEKAKELLLSTDMLSREVAFLVGFSDELYFIRFFKKHVGLTPSQFRKLSI